MEMRSEEVKGFPKVIKALETRLSLPDSGQPFCPNPAPSDLPVSPSGLSKASSLVKLQVPLLLEPGGCQLYIFISLKI